MSKQKEIYYSDKYNDGQFEYRHVMIPKDLAKLVPKTHLMSEAEWRNLGVQQSLGMNAVYLVFFEKVFFLNHISHCQAGFTTCITSQSLTFCSSGDQLPSRDGSQVERSCKSSISVPAIKTEDAYAYA